MVGDRLFEPWFPLWLIQLAKSKGAIVVSPDYRLIPEAKGVDILEDITDFWSWVHRSMPSEIQKVAPSGTKVDLEKVAVAGESAGGYLSLQSAFLFPEARIKLVMAQYAALDVDHPAYNPAPYAVPPEGSFVDKYILGLEPGAIRLSSPFPEEWDLCLAILQEGRHRDLIGEGDDVRLMSALKRAKNPPPISLVQGTEDQIMPQEVTHHFVKVMKEEHPSTPLHLTLQPGNHGLDCNTELKEDWVQTGCKFFQEYWP